MNEKLMEFLYEEIERHARCFTGQNIITKYDANLIVTKYPVKETDLWKNEWGCGKIKYSTEYVKVFKTPQHKRRNYKEWSTKRENPFFPGIYFQYGLTFNK